MIRNQYGISALVSQRSFRAETRRSVAKCRMFSQACSFLLPSEFFYLLYKNVGAWMLGPDQRCRDEPIASIQIHLKSALYIFLTKGNKTLASAEDALNLFQKFRDGINQYKSNLQRGVKSGMVQSLDECKEGIVCMKEIYRSFFTSRRPETVLTWWGVRSRINSFASGVSSRDLRQWVSNYGSNLSQSLFEGVVKHIGEPLVSLFDYLENDHMTHCVPSNVSSGLGTRPISFVFVNGTRTSEQASRTLDGTERIMEGKEAYAEILSYFTSTKHTPGE